VANRIYSPKSTNNNNKEKQDESSCATAAAAATAAIPLSTYLFCCAGETHPAYFEDLTCEQFATICATNQLGSIYTVHAMLPFMKQQQQQGNHADGGGGGGGGAIVFCSSMAGQVGVFGYTAYSPTKFAIRGFAEALHMELSCPSSSSSSSSCAPRPIHVCVAYPPDTETPCYAKENITKPMETRLISDDGGLCQPQHVARIMVDQVTERSNPPFAISFNFDGWMLSCLTAGFSPVTGLVDAVAQVAASALFRIVSLFYLQYWWYTIRKYRCQATTKRNENKVVHEAKEDQSNNSSSTTATETTVKARLVSKGKE
jgi:3-dehydrosphinganine reductase